MISLTGEHHPHQFSTVSIIKRGLVGRQARILCPHPIWDLPVSPLTGRQLSADAGFSMLVECFMNPDDRADATVDAACAPPWSVAESTARRAAARITVHRDDIIRAGPSNAMIRVIIMSDVL